MVVWQGTRWPVAEAAAFQIPSVANIEAKQRDVRRARSEFERLQRINRSFFIRQPDILLCKRRLRVF